MVVVVIFDKYWVWNEWGIVNYNFILYLYRFYYFKMFLYRLLYLEKKIIYN